VISLLIKHIIATQRSPEGKIKDFCIQKLKSMDENSFDLLTLENAPFNHVSTVALY
jgi:hypothetical protein